MCCSVLQCDAVCCGVLQCVAVRCSVMQCFTVRLLVHKCVHVYTYATFRMLIRFLCQLVYSECNHDQIYADMHTREDKHIKRKKQHAHSHTYVRMHEWT